MRHLHQLRFKQSRPPPQQLWVGWTPALTSRVQFRLMYFWISKIKCNEMIYLLFKGAKIIKSSHFDYDFELGHKIVLICVARGNPVPRITWFKDGIELYNHPYLQVNLHFNSHFTSPPKANKTKITFSKFWFRPIRNLKYSHIDTNYLHADQMKPKNYVIHVCLWSSAI